MISLKMNRGEGIVIIEPSGSLEITDFEQLTKEIDAYISDQGHVNGIIIYTKEFPGWESFGAFTHHMKFIKDRHKKVKKVAAVTDSKFMSIAPAIAKHFVSAEVKHFDYADMETAKKWIKEAVS
ncbi:MAG: STAS/SEC14 domain-containing protein [Nitrospiraceae bacterium]|nr:MAG: STAS/SEC14 domain-containing protein [Nitrospiraceae bacterium]